VDEVVRTAGEAMLTTPVRHPLSATVREIRDFFRDDHVHAALIISPSGYLEAVVERDDIADGQALDAAAAPLGRLAGRTVPAGASLAEVRQAMIASGRRRAAVTSADGRLLGLLCLKASRTGFCSDQDVRTRALDKAGAAAVDGTAVDRSGQLAGHLHARSFCMSSTSRDVQDREAAASGAPMQERMPSPKVRILSSGVMSRNIKHD
jgi:CBS domain